MKMTLRDIKQRWFIGLSVVGLYCTMWILTHLVGTAQVREAVLGAIILTGARSDFVDVTHSERPPKKSAKVYWCRAVAYAPFVVHVDYGWVAGTLTGGGGSALYVWLVVGSFRLYQLRSWAA